MLRLADGVRLVVSGVDAFAERNPATRLTLPGEAERIRRLAALLRTPRTRAELDDAIADGAPTDDLIGKLLAWGVLEPWDLAPRLSELHLATTRPTVWPPLSPEFELARMVREANAEGTAELEHSRLEGRLEDALRDRRSAEHLTGAPITLDQLGQLLGSATGTGGRRAYPSAGALYPVDVLAYPLAVETLAPRFYRYQMLSHRLADYAPTLLRSELVDLFGDDRVDGASVVLLLTSDLTRVSLGKYGEKAYRLLLLEAGHIAQNILLVATVLGFDGLPICGFRDQELAEAAGLRFPHEVVVYAVAIGRAE